MNIVFLVKFSVKFWALTSSVNASLQQCDRKPDFSEQFYQLH